MRYVARVSSGLVLLALGVFLLGHAPVGSEKEERCCYTNSHGYQGVCEVTPGEGETCASILAYLNNPQSVGKNYCGNTKVRGGWKQVPCDEKSEVTAKTCRRPRDPRS
jgi:hypothetical protein